MPPPLNPSMVIPRCSVNLGLWICPRLKKGEKPWKLEADNCKWIVRRVRDLFISWWFIESAALEG
jgi:hypothetical protein